MPLTTPSPALLRSQKSTDEKMASNPVAEYTKQALERGISDITIRSSDGVLLFLHRKNLEVITRALDAPEFLANSDSDENVISLPECHDILQIVFSFIYPNKHPKLRGLDIVKLLEIQGAVERYQIFPAMHVCKVRLEEAKKRIEAAKLQPATSD